MKIPDDPFVQELLPEFVDTWIDDIERDFDKNIKDKRSEELYRMAHTLKGSCYQFGLDDIGDMGVELMGHAKEKNWQKANEMKNGIVDGFVKVKKYLDENGIKGEI